MKTKLDVHTIWIRGLYKTTYDYGDVLDKLRRYAPEAEVHVWGRDELETLAEGYRKGLWAELAGLARPVMAVDILRWLVLWREGGLYWQLGCIPWVPLGEFVPERPEVECRLWTESIMTAEECRKMAEKPIREGVPEEPLRVAIQVFWCRRGAEFARRMVEFLLERSRRWTPKEDYDVLYITGNAAMSEAWNRFGKDNLHTELVGLEATRRMVRWQYHGMWRQDSGRGYKPHAGTEAAREPPPLGLAPVGGVKNWAKGLLYRLTGWHPHERLWRSLGTDWTGAGARQMLEEDAGEWLKTNGVRRIVRIPAEGLGSRHFRNLLYEGVPRCDLVLVADWFEWLPYHEIQRIWSQILRSGCRWLAVTTCPLLETQANRGVGDFRPLNFEMAPFLFGAPETSIPFPSPLRRQDRIIGIWDCRKLREFAGGNR